MSEALDVLIIGAGLSGIGAACHDGKALLSTPVCTRLRAC